MERKHIADRTGPRASTILSYGILGFIKIHDFRHSWIFHGSHGAPWGPHGDPMALHGGPWGPMGTHGDPWGPMGTHGDPWGPMGSHWCSGNLWVSRTDPGGSYFKKTTPPHKIFYYANWFPREDRGSYFKKTTPPLIGRQEKTPRPNMRLVRRTS